MEKDFFHHSISSAVLLGNTPEGVGQIQSPRPSMASSTGVGSGSGEEFTFPEEEATELEAQLKEYVTAAEDALDGSSSFQRAWEINQGRQVRAYGSKDTELRCSKRARLARYVAASKEVFRALLHYVTQATM